MSARTCLATLPFFATRRRCAGRQAPFVTSHKGHVDLRPLMAWACLEAHVRERSWKVGARARAESRATGSLAHSDGHAGLMPHVTRLDGRAVEARDVVELAPGSVASSSPGSGPVESCARGR